MPLIDLQCLAGATCGHTFEYQRPLAEWPHVPPCEKCGGPTCQWHPPPSSRHSPDPVIVFRAPDGSFRFPGDANGRLAFQYARDGFERIVLRGAADVRRFEKAMNRHEYSRAMRRAERQQQAREAREKDMRSELRHRMQTMSERGRAFARAVMRRNDEKPREYAKEANFHSEVYSFNRSNRDDSRDAQGRRRRD